MMKSRQFLISLKEVTEESFNLYRKFLFYFLSLSISLGIDEYYLSNLDFMPEINSNCNEFCVEFSNKKNSYLGLNYRVSHNLSLSLKSSLENEFNQYRYIHRQYGFNYLFLESKNNNVIISFKSNKSLYHESQSFSWTQFDGIFIKNFNKFNIHLNYSNSFDENWSSKVFSSFYEFKTNEIIKMYFGVIAHIDYTNKYNGIFAISFDI